LRNPDIASHVRRDFMGGVRSGVNGTPGFYVNGYLYQGDFDGLAHALGRVIARQQ
jgi:protein-disulfide isomerase